MSQKLFVDKLTIMMRFYREASGMSQSEVADALKIGLRSYQRYEAGESIPSVDLLYLLSKELNFELKEFFSPDDWKNSLSNFRVYTDGDENLFTSQEIVVKSGILEIFNSPEFKKIIETGDIKLIKENELFKNSPYCIALSQPKHTVINPALQKVAGIHSDTISSIVGHEDPRKLGMIWATFLEQNKEFYYEDKSSPVLPKGPSEMKVRGIYTAENHQYLSLNLCEINILPKKR